jgi:hypothetical protein
MLPFFDAKQHAHGVIAIGQFATGFIAIGQVAVGVVAIGQVASGVVAIGQGSIGVATIGMITLGLGRSLGMIAISILDAIGMLSVGWRARGMAAWSLAITTPGPRRELVSVAALQEEGNLQEGWISAQTMGSGEAVSWWSSGRPLKLTWDPTADGEPEKLRGNLVIHVAHVDERLVATAAEAAPRAPGMLVINGIAMVIVTLGSLAAFGMLVLRPLLEGLR